MEAFLTLENLYGFSPPALYVYTRLTMNDYEKIYDFQNLLSAHKKARRGKQGISAGVSFKDEGIFRLREGTCF